MTFSVSNFFLYRIFYIFEKILYYETAKAVFSIANEKRYAVEGATLLFC